ncbi:unnamed protein product [Callosobruchus maculatus]|uniref:Glycosyl transferase CAP10 domain-containing protein n=1 Tax=Callosobruchus maculatus TaxID=64391 RepID=A0A653BXV0_CALMS|nr:unnamed protein product [Callosobruchus maculatus]
MGLALFLAYFCIIQSGLTQVNIKETKIWGPGLEPDKIVMPARYFFVELAGCTGPEECDANSAQGDLEVKIDGITEQRTPCRTWINILNRKDGFYIVRYKVYVTCIDLKISVLYRGKHVAASPYISNGIVLTDECSCPKDDLENTMKIWGCGGTPLLVRNKLNQFAQIDWTQLRTKVIKTFDKPHSVSICHYIIKDNTAYRKCYGKYVGFNMFMDSILLSLTRKTKLPDLEMFVNLGDWPLAAHNLPEKYPIMSWCGSHDTYDIVMPTYDLTESTLENMGRVTLDVFSVQGNTKSLFKNRIPMLFWRGRDSNKHRLDLIKISRKHSDLINASMTNFFFYRDQQEEYGPKTDYISFFDFFDYKYQLAIDGTVAPYRMPYLLAGGSLVFKTDSKYYEHFYPDLEPNHHYVPVNTDLSDLVHKIKWAMVNDKEAERIAKNGQHFVNDNLTPKNVFCYYMHLLNEFSKKTVSRVDIFDDMELVNQTKVIQCDCAMDVDKMRKLIEKNKKEHQYYVHEAEEL